VERRYSGVVSRLGNVAMIRCEFFRLKKQDMCARCNCAALVRSSSDGVLEIRVGKQFFTD